MSKAIANKKSYLKRIALFFLLLPPGAELLAFEESLANKFKYNGNIFFQGFYLERDLPLEPQTGKPCAKAQWPEPNPTSTPCNEREDFYRIRFRLNLAFRPSQWSEILYGLEVGYLTFGRDSQSKTGPGSGGQGSGRTNLETRELLLRLKNSSATSRLDIGIFNFSSPSGLVVANSGAGARLNVQLPAIKSDLEAIVIRSIDNSRIDDDSNGFSDENYSDIEMGLMTLKYAPTGRIRTDFYGILRSDQDRSEDDPTDQTPETSRVYWGGALFSWSNRSWGVMLHMVGNGGHFSRPFTLTVNEKRIVDHTPELTALYNSYKAEVAAGRLREAWRRYEIAAAAGEAEIYYRFSDRGRFSLLGAAGSGRPGIEPDGSSVELRRDQFRTAGSSFQLTEIAVDTSGGYTIFNSGQLTGLMVGGAKIRYNFYNTITAELGYFSLHYYRRPVATYNENYRRFLKYYHESNYLGQEFNLRFRWQIFSDLRAELKLALFDAGLGYKIRYDIEKGDRIFESSFSIHQKF